MVHELWGECVFEWATTDYVFKVNMSTSGAPFRERPGIISHIMFTSGLHACHLCCCYMFRYGEKSQLPHESDANIRENLVPRCRVVRSHDYVPMDL